MLRLVALFGIGEIPKSTFRARPLFQKPLIWFDSGGPSRGLGSFARKGKRQDAGANRENYVNHYQDCDGGADHVRCSESVLRSACR
jgi:hypothetical protein